MKFAVMKFAVMKFALGKNSLYLLNRNGVYIFSIRFIAMRKRYILLTKQTKSMVLYLGIASLTEPTITFEKLFSLLTSDSARGFNSNQLRIIIVPGVQYIFVGCKLHKGTYINDVRFFGGHF